MCLYWKGSDGNVMNVCGGIHARTLDLHGAFCLKVWWLSLTPILFISPLLLPSSVYTNVEIESLLTLLSPYSSIEQYFSYFPHNQLSLPLFSFHLHPITLPPRFPPASPSAILLSLFFFLMPLWTKSNAAKLFGEFSPTKPMLPSLSSLRGTAVPK